MIEQKLDGYVVATPNPTMEQMTAAVHDAQNRQVELVALDKIKTRVLQLESELGGLTRAEKQAIRGMQTSRPHFDRGFARRQWRKSFGSSGTFMFRKRMPSCPSFQEYVKGANAKTTSFIDDVIAAKESKS